MAAQTLRERDAASYIGMTVSYLRAKRRGRGTPGPTFVRIGRTVLYRVKDLDRWLDVHTVENVSRPARRRA